MTPIFGEFEKQDFKRWGSMSQASTSITWGGYTDPHLRLSSVGLAWDPGSFYYPHITLI